MSLLPATSHANPTTPFWSTSGGGGGGGGAQVVASTSADVVVDVIDAFTEYLGLTYTGSGNGTYVITAYFQCSGNTPGVFYGAIGLTPAGLSAGCQQGTPGGFESMSCCLTVPNVNGIDIKVVTQSSIAGSQVKIQWNVLFFPA